MPEIIIIAAVAKNRVIGKDNQLIWNIPEDMAHFKSLTQGHTVVMGRKTWESLPPRFRPLPGRRNIVVTRQADYLAPGAETVFSVEEAIALAMDTQKLFVIVGAEIYTAAIHTANILELTEVNLSPDGDAWFPTIEKNEWLVNYGPVSTSTSGVQYRFNRYERILKTPQPKDSFNTSYKSMQ